MSAVADLFEARKLTLIAGPCVVEAADMCLQIGERVRAMCEKRGISYIFKASYDKANRTSGGSFRGPVAGTKVSLLWRGYAKRSGVPGLDRCP